MRSSSSSSLMRDCFSPADAFIALMLFCMEWSAVSRSSVVKSCFACKKRFQFMRPAMGATRNSKQQQPSPIFQFMRPAMGATARFRYYLAIYTRFSIYLSFLYTIIFNHHFHFLFFGASLPVFLCMLITRTLHLIQLS